MKVKQLLEGKIKDDSNEWWKPGSVSIKKIHFKNYIFFGQPEDKTVDISKLHSDPKVAAMLASKMPPRKPVRPDGPQGSFGHCTPKQLEKEERLNRMGYWSTNGFNAWSTSLGEKDFSADIIILTKAGEKGAMVIFPSGKVEEVASKAWVPSKEDFLK